MIVLVVLYCRRSFGPPGFLGPKSGDTLTAYSLPQSGQSRFSGPGYMNAFGQISPTFCLSCHDTTPQAQFYKQQSVLANLLDWRVIAYEQLLGTGLSLGFGEIAEDMSVLRSLSSIEARAWYLKNEAAIHIHAIKPRSSANVDTVPHGSRRDRCRMGNANLWNRTSPIPTTLAVKCHDMTPSAHLSM